MATTFKDDARRELLTVLPKSECCIKAFLSALSKASGTIEGSGRRRVLSVALDTLEAADAVAELFRKLYPIELAVTEHRLRIAGAERRIYKVSLPNGFSAQALEDFEITRLNAEGLIDFTRGVPQQLLSKQCCMKAYFKGLYLACGSVYAPSTTDDEKKDGYHFELKIADEDYADAVMELLSDLRINTRMSDRNGNKLIYAKDRDEIVRILCTLELSDSATRMQTIIDERETANLLNRAVICETANMDKTFAASSRHMIAIARLKDRGEYEKLSPALRQTADARALYSEASMQELADILKVSKSCLHHRLTKLESLADSIE